MHKPDLPIVLSYQVCPGPRAKTIQQMSLPLPKAGITQTLPQHVFHVHCRNFILFYSKSFDWAGPAHLADLVLTHQIAFANVHPQCLKILKYALYTAHCSQCSLTIHWIISFSQLVRDTIHLLHAMFFGPSICECFPNASSLICSKAWCCSGAHVK